MYCSNIMNNNNELNNIESNEIDENNFYSDSIGNIRSTDNDNNQQKVRNFVHADDKNENEITKIEKYDQKEVEEVEIDHWPFWYTWPLISRIAFTLGNLTTSNNKNRYYFVYLYFLSKLLT